MPRKHQGINQTTGKLNKGYKYGKKLKSGLRQVVKVSKKTKSKPARRRQIGGISPYEPILPIEIRKSISDDDFEICGYIDTVDHKFIYINRGESKKKKEKASCPFSQIKQYTHSWHTHPSTSKYYPSTTDLWKNFKYNQKTMIIFTRYGMWQIQYDGKKKYKKIPQEICYKIKEIETNFYNNTERGRDWNKEAVDKYKKEINELLKLTKKSFNIEFIKKKFFIKKKKKIKENST